MMSEFEQFIFILLWGVACFSLGFLLAIRLYQYGVYQKLINYFASKWLCPRCYHILSLFKEDEYLCKHCNSAYMVNKNNVLIEL